MFRECSSFLSDPFVKFTKIVEIAQNTYSVFTLYLHLVSKSRNIYPRMRYA